MITHYDLFAGIGGFSLALEEVFDGPVRHIFCEWESFPTSVLRRHWPDGEFWGDIAELVTHTNDSGLEGRSKRGTNTSKTIGGKEGAHGNTRHSSDIHDFTIVTGGFPCQPFSHAGRRKGTADDRYQWPNMFAVIRHTKPEWVIAENVRGLVTWNEGMVLETVCADLESEGYEVQPFIIPAVAVGAPHRRDRVWIIGHRIDSNSKRIGDGSGEVQSTDGEVPERYDYAEPGNADRHLTDSTSNRWAGGGQAASHEEGYATGPEQAGQLARRFERPHSDVADTGREHGRPGTGGVLRPKSQESEQAGRQYPDWSRHWQEVAFATCDDTVDDGLSRLVDGVPYSRAKWRQHSLKAYGNGIVPAVAVQIMKAIRETYDDEISRSLEKITS